MQQPNNALLTVLTALYKGHEEIETLKASIENLNDLLGRTRAEVMRLNAENEKLTKTLKLTDDTALAFAKRITAFRDEEIQRRCQCNGKYHCINCTVNGI